MIKTKQQNHKISYMSRSLKRKVEINEEQNKIKNDECYANINEKLDALLDCNNCSLERK